MSQGGGGGHSRRLCPPQGSSPLSAGTDNTPLTLGLPVGVVFGMIFDGFCVPEIDVKMEVFLKLFFGFGEFGSFLSCVSFLGPPFVRALMPLGAQGWSKQSLLRRHFGMFLRLWQHSENRVPVYARARFSPSGRIIKSMLFQGDLHGLRKHVFCYTHGFICVLFGRPWGSPGAPRRAEKVFGGCIKFCTENFSLFVTFWSAREGVSKMGGFR